MGEALARRRDEVGSTLPLHIGFAAILLVLVAVVVDASAAFLRRQSVDTLADGAALHGADLGAQGREAYAGGLAGDRLRLTRSSVQRQVEAYLREVDAHRRYPGLTYRVRVDAGGERVEVVISTPLELPLGVPGVATRTTVQASGSASVLVER